MFCPKCSQQQVSDETRFCSRCGFQLNVVKALLVNDEMPPSPDAAIQKINRSLRKRDMTFGALFMFVFAMIVAAITIDLPPSHSAPILFLIIAWLVLTLLINVKPMIQYFLQADSSTKDISTSETFSNLTAKIKQAALPSSQSIPAEDLVAPNRNTAEMVKPPSITERTTNLLDEK